jgi:hypothetical protein
MKMEIDVMTMNKMKNTHPICADAVGATDRYTMVDRNNAKTEILRPRALRVGANISEAYM